VAIDGKKIVDMFIHFDSIHDCDGRTDRQTGRAYA